MSVGWKAAWRLFWLDDLFNIYLHGFDLPGQLCPSIPSCVQLCLQGVVVLAVCLQFLMSGYGIGFSAPSLPQVPGLLLLLLVLLLLLLWHRVLRPSLPGSRIPRCQGTPP